VASLIRSLWLGALASLFVIGVLAVFVLLLVPLLLGFGVWITENFVLFVSAVAFVILTVYFANSVYELELEEERKKKKKRRCCER